VGYRKSVRDVTAPISKVAASTDVIAGQLLWKVPCEVGVLNLKILLLTRMGEALFRCLRPRGFETQRPAPRHDQLDRLGVGAAVQAVQPQSGAQRAHGG
jgi:hypothetical protein